MHQPVSIETKQNLYNTMGNIIQQYSPILDYFIQYRKQILTISNQNDSLNNINNFIELFCSTLYVNIEIATILRADLRTNLVIEKRVNLKYIVSITCEFYKAIFWGKNSLWTKVKAQLASFNEDNINSDIRRIEQLLLDYEAKYFNNDKNSRDISIHYDLDVKELYHFLLNISEEQEAQRICDLLTLLETLHKTLTIILTLFNFEKQTHHQSIIQDTKLDQKIIDTFRKHTYDEIGYNVEYFAQNLNKLMRMYSIPEQISQKLSTTISSKILISSKEYLQRIHMPILLHYFYMDLGVAIRGFITSEYPIERRFNLMRINLIMYEAYLIICQKTTEGQNTLWEICKQDIHLHCNDESLKQEFIEIDDFLTTFSRNIKMIRHNYVHIKKNGDFYLPRMWDVLTTIPVYVEIEKATKFLNTLNRIIQFSKLAMKEFLKNNNKTQAEELTKIMECRNRLEHINISSKEKQQLLATIDRIIELVSNTCNPTL